MSLSWTKSRDSSASLMWRSCSAKRRTPSARGLPSTRICSRSTRRIWAVLRTDSGADCQVAKQPLSLAIACWCCPARIRSLAWARRRSASSSWASTSVSAWQARARGAAVSTKGVGGVGGLDEEGVAVEGDLAEAAHLGEVGFLAVDQDVDDEAVFLLEVGEELAEGLEAQLLGGEGLAIDGDGH